MKTPLFKTIARVTGARKAKRLISELAFSEPRFHKVDERQRDILNAFNCHEELRGWTFWFDLALKHWRLTYKPCCICNDNDDVHCDLCSIPF